MQVKEIHLLLNAGIVLLLCAAAAGAITFSPPEVVVSPPPPMTPGPEVGETFETPGLVFSFIVSGFESASSFGDREKDAVCKGVVEGMGSDGMSKVKQECRIASVIPFGSSSALVNGYSWFNWTSTPSIDDLNVAKFLSKEKVTQLLGNTSALFPFLKDIKPNCACKGLEKVTDSSTLALNFLSNLTGIPGPVQCSARLIYDKLNPSGIINVVGLDDGSVIAANKGKFCSMMAVKGGITGLPGSGPCKQYGIVAKEVESKLQQATCNSPPPPIDGSINANNVCGVSVPKISVRVPLNVPTSPGLGYLMPPNVTVSAPDPLPAQVIATLSGAEPVFLVANAASNGPYAATPPATLGGGTCVSNGCSGGMIAMIDATDTPRKAYQCTSSDVAVRMSGTMVSKVSLIPQSRSIPVFCTVAPTVTVSTSFMQSAVNAVIVAQIEKTLVTRLIVTSAGSGYRTAPTITIAPPLASDYLGKLCGPSPIEGLPSSIAYNLPLEITTTGICQPLGFDTFNKQVCSNPATIQEGGTFGDLGIGTCDVLSAFRVDPNSITTSNCAILTQRFTTITNIPDKPIAKPPERPPFEIARPPARPPVPNPTPLVCKYDGVYNLSPSYSPCSNIYIASGTDSDCDNSLVTLRTDNQLGGKFVRKNWRLSTTFLGGKSTPTKVEALARKGCPLRKNLAAPNLIASDGALKVGGSRWEWQVVPHPGESESCENVNLVSQNLGDMAFLGVSTSCTRFMYSPTDGDRQRFRITPVRN
eukprot:jgi/Picsp_1/2090/NSC_05555-R1_---NA---